MISEYIRVTDVLFPFSGLSKIDAQVLWNAAERGTKVHKFCESIINGFGMFGFEEEIKGYLSSFNEWAEGKKFIDKPERFFNKEYMITGECDCVYEDDQGLVLVDLKTSAKEGKTWKLQGSAYSFMAKQAGYDIKRIEFVRLPKTGGKAKVHIYEEDFEMFLKCLEMYKCFFKDIKEEALDFI
jgi:hypothetical protein